MQPTTHTQLDTAVDRCPVSGLELRYAALIVLDQRFGRPRTIPEILEDLRSLGVSPTGTRPNKVLADALRWEVRRGRIERVAHGRYRLGVLPDSTRRRARRTIRRAVEASHRVELSPLQSEFARDHSVVVANAVGDAERIR